MKIFYYLFKILTYLFGICGPLLMLGSVGALEHDNISISQFLVQLGISIVVIALAFLTYEFEYCSLHNYRAAQHRKARFRKSRNNF